MLITDYTFLISEVYFLQNNGKCCHPTICLCIILKNLWISLALPRGQILLTMTWLSDIGTTTVSEHFQVFFGCSLTLPHSTSFLPKFSLTLGLPYNIPPNNSGSSPYLACCSNPLQLSLSCVGIVPMFSWIPGGGHQTIAILSPPYAWLSPAPTPPSSLHLNILHNCPAVESTW